MIFQGKDGELRIMDFGYDGTSSMMKVLFSEMDFDGPISRPRTEEELIMDRNQFDSNSHYIEKDEHEAHDVLLAIGMGQTRASSNRIAYPVPEFYLKSGEEVKAFFARHFTEEYAEELCANTIYFADKCEQPDWIDPKFSNPSGKELPRFPVKDQLD